MSASQQVTFQRAPISVCLATYNGARYLTVQITSILQELLPDDEVVVVDDHSNDGTVELLSSFGDPRLRVYANERNLGVNQSFARAIGLARRDYIFMADQDDRWVPGRLVAMADALSKGSLVVTGQQTFMDAEGVPIDFPAHPAPAADSGRYLKNIARVFIGNSGYFGCIMAFRRELTPLILPIPGFVESHDLWIALAGNLCRSNVHLDSNTLVRRVHGSNASLIQRTMFLKIRARLIFAVSVLVLLLRGAGWRRISRANAVQNAVARGGRHHTSPP